MRRRGFLAGTVGLFVGLRHGKLPAPEAELPVMVEVSESALEGIDWIPSGSLVSAGGLCAPLTPFYDLPGFSSARPIAEVIPIFKAEREKRS